MPRPSPGDRPAPDEDATVVLRPAPTRGPRRWPWFAAGLLVVAGAGLAVVLLRPAPPVPPPPAPPAATAPVVPPPPAPAPPAPRPEFALQTADEAAILADPAEHLTLFRFAPDPSVVVLDFPSLDQQGRMLNRVAALVEKAGLPRDRVLTDTELDAAIRSHGDTVATYYYGHDYPAAALARFFALADRDHVALAPEEERLRALLRQLGWLDPKGQASGALISLSRQGADPDITREVRAAILHHELSHGAFFAEPAYEDYVRHFWQTALAQPERDGITKFLASEDYDPADERLMVNEMQAYLMFTYDPHFFLPSNVGMTEARRAALQAAFRRDLPVPWLRAAMAAAGVGDAPVAAIGASTRQPATSASAPHQPAAAPH